MIWVLNLSSREASVRIRDSRAADGSMREKVISRGYFMASTSQMISRTRKIRVESHINTRLRSRFNQYWPQSQTSRDPALRSGEGFGRERSRAVVPPRRTHPRLAAQTEGRR